MTDITRRGFIGTAAGGFGWMGCGRLFAAAPGAFTGGRPLLKFGVVSDIHFRLDLKTGALAGWSGDETFVRTLECFRDSGVDAVLVAGDLADCGLVAELEAVAAAWNRVFPGNRAPDGRPVEKLFVYGNHDYEGFKYGLKDRLAAKWPGDELKKHILRTDMKGNWERIFQEPYEPVYVKNVKGYTFIGAHWPCWSGRCEAAVKTVTDAAAACDPAKPFFFFQHPHPRDTVYGPWAWGHDNGTSTKALAAFPNAVAFSGHSHYSLADERSVWQGSFTSFGTASLRYIGQTYDEFYPEGLANSNAPYSRLEKAIEAVKIGRRADSGSQQGMIVSVYADRMTVERRDFQAGLSMGDDWVMPLPLVKAGAPYAFEPRRRKARAPRFAAGAAVTVKGVVRAKNRAGAEKDVVRIVFPAANAAAERPYVYEAGVETRDGSEVLSKRFLAESYCVSRADRRYGKDMTADFLREELPEGEELRFTVRPRGWFGAKGRAITSDWTATTRL